MKMRSRLLVAGASAGVACGLALAAGAAGAGEFQAWQGRIGVSSSVQKKGLDGKDVRIGILDTGVETSHPEFRNAAVRSASTSLVSTPWNDDATNHGTAVASVALARRDGKGIVGVAPAAKLVGVKIGDPGSTIPLIAEGIRHAADNGAQVINVSFATNGWSPALPADTALADALAYAATRSVLVFAAGNEGLTVPNWLAMHLLGAGVRGSGIIVGSVDAANAPSAFSNKPGAAAIDGAAAKNLFLMAPGEALTLATPALGYRTGSGTSFAAPAVAGAAALVKAMHPHLTSAQIVDILLRTAQDIGAAGADDNTGRGLLRVDKALAPVGTTRIPTGTTVAQAVPAKASGISAPRAAGAMPGVAAALSDGVIVDDYGRDFAADLSAGLLRPGPRLGVRQLFGLDSRGRRMIETNLPGGFRFATTVDAWSDRPAGGATRSARFTTDPTVPDRDTWSLGGRIGADSFAFGFGPGAVARMPEAPAEASLFLSAEGGTIARPVLALAEGGAYVHVLHDLSEQWSLGVGFVQGERSAWGGEAAGARALSFRTRFTPMPGFAFELSPTMLDERDSALGGVSQGAFDLGSRTRTVGLDASFTAEIAEGLTFSGHLTQAFSRVEGAGSSLFRNVSSLRSEAMGVSLSRANVLSDGDRLGFAVDRPLRLRSGRAAMDVPVGRGEDGSVAYDRREVDLEPSGSETTFELSYARSLPLGAIGSLHLIHQEDAGHVAGARAEAVVGRVRLAF
ncbi:S8 family serine peptidase [Arenibaculum pallidiluteum]|uniref:S8 family serine peptidase n=1 Tax=Arenibaculum pallidiluteum TaxID=2812559 RepID=UPI001A978B43|nr:S8 family serine peptidase [Arenibaculum pallidiluteum]